MYFYNINFCLKIFNIMGVHPVKKGNIIQTLLYITSIFFKLKYILLLVFKEHVTITDITDSIETIGLLLHVRVRKNFAVIELYPNYNTLGIFEINKSFLSKDPRY
ncbi:hypothetical protein NQ315_000059 [Exocentrus adspersus]|uniref:Uncharacterized protein n=1 Tax=Exocentrus adspersus TaxID=1586481 RepID=A0AAV8VV21_9CUCU|nr:hypothetical protein NQ315_000059 [Exocentrus adspersus]